MAIRFADQVSLGGGSILNSNELRSIDLLGVMSVLARKRAIFHSEADFQHALAWELQQPGSESLVRLEYPFRDSNKRRYLDIRVRNLNVVHAVELKYKTRGLRCAFAEEDFELLDQSAQDIGRYDFLADVERLERLVAQDDHVIGIAMLLTNDSSYWSAPRNYDSVDASFRLNEGRRLTGELRWGPAASSGTIRGREKPIILRGSYAIEWRDYSSVGTGPYNKFRYLTLAIT